MSDSGGGVSTLWGAYIGTHATSSEKGERQAAVCTRSSTFGKVRGCVPIGSVWYDGWRPSGRKELK